MKDKYKKILLISLDTFRLDGIRDANVDFFNYSLSKKIKPSQLDLFLKKSCFFSNTISVAPYTAASHAAYFTGRYPKNNGIYDHYNSKLKIDTIFSNAKKHGFETYFKTDFPLILGKHLNFTKDVDFYFSENTNNAFEKFNKSKKAFGFFHFGNIHIPYGFQSLSVSGSAYKNKVFELEKKYNLTFDKRNFTDVAVEIIRSEEDLNLLYRYKNIVNYLFDNQLYEEILDLYAEGINFFNEHIFNDFLKEVMNRADKNNWLVVLFSDHGENWNNISYGHFNSSEDECLRVPLLLYGKNIPSKTILSRIRTIDLFPTLNELVFNDEIEVDGISLLSLIYSDKSHDNRDAFSGIWINEMKDISTNLSDVINKDNLDTTKSRSIKYCACYFYKNMKCVIWYHKFLHGAKKLQEVNEINLFEYNKYGKLIPVDNSNKLIIEICKEKIEELNVSEEINETFIKNELKEYMRMLGYGV